jgi:hypothetical protein
MLMVLIVNVRMCVLHRLMGVLMFMMLGEVQPDTDSHQRAGRHELKR